MRTPWPCCLSLCPASGLQVTTELEAKRLGFYLFWNIKADFDRCASCPLPALLPCACPAASCLAVAAGRPHPPAALLC